MTVSYISRYKFITHYLSSIFNIFLKYQKNNYVFILLFLTLLYYISFYNKIKIKKKNKSKSKNNILVGEIIGNKEKVDPT